MNRCRFGLNERVSADLCEYFCEISRWGSFSNAIAAESTHSFLPSDLEREKTKEEPLKDSNSVVQPLSASLPWFRARAVESVRNVNNNTVDFSLVCTK